MLVCWKSQHSDSDSVSEYAHFDDGLLVLPGHVGNSAVAVVSWFLAVFITFSKLMAVIRRLLKFLLVIMVFSYPLATFCLSH